MENTCGKECCTNCKFFNIGNGGSAWITNYYCTVDGTDRLLGKFDNYTGHATNTTRIKLESRRCKYFRPRTDTLEQRYAQLEKVARNLYSYARALLSISFREEGLGGEESKQLINEETVVFRDQLESLGVSVDD